MKRWRIPAMLAAACIVLACADWWPHVRNEFFVLLGSRNESGGWYGFHSGFGGAAYIMIFPAVTLWYYHNTCHEKPSCLRWGAYEVAGGVGKKCHKHHPDLRDHPRERHGAVLDQLHREHHARRM